MKNRCDFCQGRFGLIVHYYGLKRFCSNMQNKQCKLRYKLGQPPVREPRKEIQLQQS